jgi:heavy metal efflux system protein
MAKVPGVADLGLFHLVGQPNLNIRIDRDKAARYGLNTGDVNTVVQAALGGTNATTVLEADRQFAVTLRLDSKYRSDIDAIRTIKVAYQTPSGTNGYVPLSEIAAITLDTGASFIYRERHPDQVQRPRPRPRLDGRRSPGADRQGDQAAAGLSDPVGRRV